MHFIATLAGRAAEAGLPFLLIGGNAVIAYGYARQTADWDFLPFGSAMPAFSGRIVSLESAD